MPKSFLLARVPALPAFGLAALVALMQPAMARENRALIIAASDYDNLDEGRWLIGPKNDAELVANYLLAGAPVPFAAENVTVLTDGVRGFERATLANIRAAFARLAEVSEPGDFVYVHFAGHGSQQPAHDPESELDGLDEIFLPVDIGRWSSEVATVENALVDDEIGAMLDAIRARGADVFVVFDSCHSGTATRGVETDDDVRLRRIDPADLGVPEEAPDEGAQTRGLGDDPRAAPVAPMDALDEGGKGGAGTGSLVAFYAAQTTELTPEMKLPKGDVNRRPQGVFTYTLFETLAEYPGASYGQIAQEVLRKYSLRNWTRTTPLFEGDLDRTVFDGSPQGRVAQWKATPGDDGLTIPAGRLHGLAEGEELAVMATAGDSIDKALGFVRITRLDTFSATAQPVSEAGKTPPADLPAGIFLRRLGTDLDFSLTVALPPADSAPAAALGQALDALKEAAGPRIAFVAPGEAADLVLAVLPDSARPDALWILPATGLMEDPANTPSIGTADKSPAELADVLAETLGRMAKAFNLMRLGDAVGAGDLDVAVEMQLTPADDPRPRELSFSTVPTLFPDDTVRGIARNNMDIPVDVNVLYIGADYSITHLFSGRLQPSDVLKNWGFRVSDEALGRERMIIIATPAGRHTAVEDLSWLAQNALEMTRDAGLAAGSGLDAALAEAGFGAAMRGAVPLSDPGADGGPAPMIVQLEVRTKAAE